MSSCTVPFFDARTLFFSTVKTALQSDLRTLKSGEDSSKAHPCPPCSFYDLSEVGL